MKEKKLYFIRLALLENIFLLLLEENYNEVSVLFE